MRMLWLGLSPLSRVVLLVVGCVSLAAFAVPLAQMVSELAAGMAVLIIALFGLRMIVMAPFRGR